MIDIYRIAQWPISYPPHFLTPHYIQLRLSSFWNIHSENIFNLFIEGFREKVATGHFLILTPGGLFNPGSAIHLPLPFISIHIPTPQKIISLGHNRV